MAKRALLLGGNGMVGGEVAVALADAGFDITAVSRGRTYWDSDSRLFGIFTAHVVVNRDDSEWPAALHSPSMGRFDVVVDLSSYTKKDMVAAATNFAREEVCGLYIYISSDSVYEVCEAASHDGPSIETDAKRPADDGVRRQLRRRDRYGDGKLAGEEQLEKRATTAFVCLRLADVSGPRDNTDRWVQLMLWLWCSAVHGTVVHVPTSLISRKMSFVDARDVAGVVAAISCAKTPPPSRAYNLACSEPLFLRELMLSFATALGIETKVSLTELPDDHARTLFPSVDRGPVSIALAEAEIGWQPMTFLDTIPGNCLFYTKALLARDPSALDGVDEFLSDNEQLEMGQNELLESLQPLMVQAEKLLASHPLVNVHTSTRGAAD